MNDLILINVDEYIQSHFFDIFSFPRGQEERKLQTCLRETNFLLVPQRAREQGRVKNDADEDLLAY